MGNIYVEILFWTVSWGIFDRILKYKIGIPVGIVKEEDAKKKIRGLIDYQHNQLSFYHSFVVIFVSTYLLISEPFQRSRSFTEMEFAILKCSLGYFIFDTVEGFRLKYNDLAMTVHHIAVFACYFQAFYYNDSASECVATLLVGEMSNPFNILRILFTYENRQKDCNLCGGLFVIAFLIARGLFAPILAWLANFNPNINYILKINCALMMFISYMWMWKIANLGAKGLQEVMKGTPWVETLYATLVSARKYQWVWVCFSLIFSFYWIANSIYYDIYGWEAAGYTQTRA